MTLLSSGLDQQVCQQQFMGSGETKTLLIEKGKDGGQIILTSEIENYPGSLEKNLDVH